MVFSCRYHGKRQESCLYVPEKILEMGFGENQALTCHVFIWPSAGRSRTVVHVVPLFAVPHTTLMSPCVAPNVFVPSAVLCTRMSDSSTSDSASHGNGKGKGKG